MPLPGNAFLALWNDHDAARTDYGVWHTREHVVERLGVPGILSARRYVGGEGALPRFFTLYSLDDLDVLLSVAYRDLIENPTDWSMSMRPDLTDFLRRGCRLVASFGAGIGGCAVVGFFRCLAEAGEAHDVLARLAADPAFTGAHLGLVEEGVAAVSFGGDEPAGLSGRNAVLVLEGYEPDALRAAAEQVSEIMRRDGIAAEFDLVPYRLAFALDQAQRSAMLAVARGEA